MKATAALFSLFSFFTCIGQQQNDPLRDTLPSPHAYMPEITVVGRGSRSDIQQIPEVVGTSIYAGKKNALVLMDNVKGNVVNNTMRQVMAKVPGIHVWESDGSGIQIGIAARGLSPNRSWEFNVRQNGYDVAADPFGYPEAYYNPQLQAVQRIEVVRGHGSLQYGPQFGGMVNYILRNGHDINKPFAFETQQTIGSFGLFNSYNAIGGETEKFHYYGFFDHRNAEGWRDNSRYFTNSGFGSFTWRIDPKFSLTTEVMISHIRSQQPGGLTDSLFSVDPVKSFRSRNWFDISWRTAAIIGNYTFSPTSKLNVKLFGMSGDRNSVGFLRSILIADTIQTATGTYNNRTVDIDLYRNWGLEGKFITDFKVRDGKHTLSAGVRYFNGNTYRYRDGKGSTGSDYDIGLVNGIWPRDIDYSSGNAAVFAETILRLSEKLLVVPGIRIEYLRAKATGRNGFDANGKPIELQNLSRGRSFVLGGLGLEYHLSEKTEFYANITQAYRPMQFADLTAPPTTNVVDPNLKDARGFNADVGYRGQLKNYLYFDVSAFWLRYNNRIGTILQQRSDGSFYNLTTNVGDSRSLGVEAVVECNPVRAVYGHDAQWGSVAAFVSYAYTDARYGEVKVYTKTGSDLTESSLKNNRVENAPLHILRGGLTYFYKNFSLSGQLSHVGDVFSDANNTIAPSANGQNGLIPAYTVIDMHLALNISEKFTFKAGLNNLTNAAYFTRRAGGYPGPGLMPSDGRGFFVTVGARF